MPLSSSRLMYARSQYTSETKHCSGGLDVVCYTAFFFAGASSLDVGKRHPGNGNSKAWLGSYFN
jgi:hypothetical protein